MIGKKEKDNALPETNSSHMKLDAWKMFLGFGLFSEGNM